ncbi:hypothetical protein L3Q82_016205, partial [Scortum barcoo]
RERERERERARERDTLNSERRFFFCCSCVSSSRSSRGTSSREFKWAEANALHEFLAADPCVRMNSNSKSVTSTAIKAEIKRHESLQSAINRLSKQFERVADQQLRSGLKVYLHSIQGKFTIFLTLFGGKKSLDHMSGGGALQQRTTYLISLTLVKVEAVEENGGEAKSSTQGKEVEAGPGGRAGEEAKGEAPAQAENGAGVISGGQQRAEDAAAVKGGTLTDELKDEERKPASPLKEKPADVQSKEKPPCNLSISLPAERVQKSADVDLTRVEKTVSTPEPKQCRSPSLTTTPPAEVAEPSRTPTRTSLPIRPVGQRPVSLLKSHSSVATRGRESRDGRERSPTSAQSLDRKDCRVPTRIRRAPAGPRGLRRAGPKDGGTCGMKLKLKEYLWRWEVAWLQ